MHAAHHSLSWKWKIMEIVLLWQFLDKTHKANINGSFNGYSRATDIKFNATCTNQRLRNATLFVPNDAFRWTYLGFKMTYPLKTGSIYTILRA